MKATITRPDGTVIKVRGTPEQVAEVVREVSPAGYPYWTNPWAWPQPYTFTYGVDLSASDSVGVFNINGNIISDDPS